ncbi:hypothetical protein FQR65_LT00970 [Abscondita terminalis]|nr:hypothetical protein FQR65_LT00970 [Abscondita terminalis]
MKTALSIFLCVAVGFTFLGAFPMLPEDDGDYEILQVNDTNGTAHDLYVIRTIVYEVGILTDADNDTDFNQSFEEINLKFFDPEHNGTTLDLSNIPPPIMTNFTGATLTSITDGNFTGFPFPIFNQSDSSQNFSFNGPNYFIRELVNISTTDPKEELEILERLSLS